MENKRREFIKKAGLVSVGIGLLPGLSIRSAAEESLTSVCNPATLDYYGEGPFYTANPPELSNGVLAKSNEPGERMIISGRVTNLDCTEFIKNAVIDVWHADNAGNYDNVGFNLRGKVQSDAQGYYSFETIKLGKYLNGQEYRPSQIHFKITAPGKPVVITQLYFAVDSSIPNDAAASISSGTYDARHRIIPLTKVNGKWEGTWDIAIAGEGEMIETGISTSHLEKGMIYHVFPNPVRDVIKIKFGVFHAAKVSLELFDISGKRIDAYKQGALPADKYEISWRPHTIIEPGEYMLALTINDMPMQYLKVLKED